MPLFSNKVIITIKWQMWIMPSPKLNVMGDSPYKAAFSPGISSICVHVTGP